MVAVLVAFGSAAPCSELLIRTEMAALLVKTKCLRGVTLATNLTIKPRAPRPHPPGEIPMRRDLNPLRSADQIPDQGIERSSRGFGDPGDLGRLSDETLRWGRKAPRTQAPPCASADARCD
ncbi:hypothetical protein D4764_13G0010210 [Takifugu flavidus]|uniref:Uncharacterized protein n=1 Tax=Takifugu flavidus TaxID=433684 RepID=A0A5C6PBH5_9TELE|nr:hypothetical protein D4764_13G0010210 [Takifugu flavidus]